MACNSYAERDEFACVNDSMSRECGTAWKLKEDVMEVLVVARICSNCLRACVVGSASIYERSRVGYS